MVVRAKPSSMWTSMWYLTQRQLRFLAVRIDGDERPAAMLAGRDERRLGGDHQVAGPVQRRRRPRRRRDLVARRAASSWPVVSFWSRPETSTLPWVTRTPVPASFAVTANLVPRAVTDRFGVSTTNRSDSVLAGHGLDEHLAAHRA